ncbi:DNA-binding protein [Bremerella cremea]|uniref:DNA-binding protein n=1 Tax=Bremerella cremea TaxID=1031537 RepID=A0A368KZ70_9BACT|nr:DNA-binding protein [Bremerella cremea]RCS55916.1 DNA-binding protein [Bremerella cremea]
MARKKPRKQTPLPKMAKPALRVLQVELGSETLEEVCQYSRRQVLALHGMGPSAMAILEQALAANGLCFANDS